MKKSQSDINRGFAILALPEAKGREMQARQLADLPVTVEQARGILAATPKRLTIAGPALALAGNPEIEPDGCESDFDGNHDFFAGARAVASLRDMAPGQVQAPGPGLAPGQVQAPGPGLAPGQVQAPGPGPTSAANFEIKPRRLSEEMDPRAAGARAAMILLLESGRADVAPESRART